MTTSVPRAPELEGLQYRQVLLRFGVSAADMREAEVYRVP